MRRLRQEETLHGTRHGQLVVDSALREAHGLTDREAAVAALLTRGATRAAIAENLGISPSTTEKHLASLRTKLGAQSTTEAAAILARHSVVQAAGEPQLGTNPHHEAHTPSGLDAELATRLAGAADVEAAVFVLRDHLAPLGVAAVGYGFVPLNAVSFRRGEAILAWAGAPGPMEAHVASGGLLRNPVALRIFSEPDREVVVDADGRCWNGPALEPAVPDALREACHADRLPVCVSLGSPFGCGFVGASMFFRGRSAEAIRDELPTLGPTLRSALMSTQSSVFARGVLAREADLTVRERDALSLVAQGLTLEQAAEQLGGTVRSLSGHLRSARTKLGARSNTEAVARAMAVNALVFL